MANRRETVFGYRVFYRDAEIGTTTRWIKNQPVNCHLHRTTGQAARHWSKGRFLVWSNRHSFAIIDGIVHDNGAARPRGQVTGVYEFIPSSECERRGI